MNCSRCGAENRAGRKFCASCGGPLAVVCPSCGAGNDAGDRFCGECGAALVAGAAAASPSAPQPAGGASERRLVSVLFADLVGFTTLSESRDAEEVRELLTRYFETCRQLIGRYGGVVEKFIGDAVMAVWGTPVAQEDDAERAVRAALELTAAVSALGQEAGAPGLRARAGVLTGEASVTFGSQAEGMVAGDLVNTASRVQSVAEPGAVFVGDSTRRSSEGAIAYEDAGTFELKGKAEPVKLWRAKRVVGGVGGVMKSERLEPPFVGLDRELRLVKELFHASAEGSKAHLVSVIGVAGVGKSRLAWEFFKYVDGLVEGIRWHRGRCLAYGEGVTYWALAEMVRTRADITEGEDQASALAKLRVTAEEVFPDPDERRWVEPRLANLLGLEGATGRDREDLFAAWRMFYERLAAEMPTIMVFEDCQWADQALLDFIEYLREWSHGSRLFILALARPDLVDRRPTWGAASRGGTSLTLDRLPPGAMTELLEGLVPGLPDELRERILERAEGIPLYAIETVRMLIDRGLLVPEGATYRPSGTITSLEVPETLHALIAARLDGLAVEERRLLQDAAVLGRTFTKRGLVLLSGQPEDHVDSLLGSLVRKEILSIQADPRSPERGQYGFLQDLVKHVAYGTISKKDRKAAHLAAVSALVSESDEQEIVEVLASHYLNAYLLAPDAPDAADIKTKARTLLAKGGERAASLAALGEATRYFMQAVELADDPAIRAGLLERAAQVARGSGDIESAVSYFQQAGELFRTEGLTHPAARVAARLAEVMWDTGRIGDALADMDRAFDVLKGDEPDENLAELAAQLGRLLFFGGQQEAGMERIETALEIAEGLLVPEVLSQALTTKAIYLYTVQGRVYEGYALLEYALKVALDNDLPGAALRAYYNLADIDAQTDQYREATDRVEAGLALARRIGNKLWEWNFLGQLYGFYALGEWDRVMDLAGQQPTEKAAQARGSFLQYISVLPLVCLFRGDVEGAKKMVDVFPEPERSDDVQERTSYLMSRAAIRRAEGDAAGALVDAELALGYAGALGTRTDGIKEAFLEAVEAAFELGDLQKVETLVTMIEELPRGKRPRYLEAHAARFRARLAAARGEDEAVEPLFKAAAGMLLETAVPFWAAVVQLEHAEWLAERGRASDAQPLLADAATVFERLRAVPFIERAKAVAVETVEAP